MVIWLMVHNDELKGIFGSHNGSKTGFFPSNIHTVLSDNPNVQTIQL